jgi:hypothetical protein
LSSVEEWSLLENGTNISMSVSYPLLNATSMRQDPRYAKNVVFILNLFTMGKHIYISNKVVVGKHTINRAGGFMF